MFPRFFCVLFYPNVVLPRLLFHFNNCQLKIKFIQKNRYPLEILHFIIETAEKLFFSYLGRTPLEISSSFLWGPLKIYFQYLLHWSCSTRGRKFVGRLKILKLKAITFGGNLIWSDVQNILI